MGSIVANTQARGRIARIPKNDAVKSSSQTKPPFQDALQQQVLVLDGAMGTQLYQRGIPFHQSFESANLEHPQWVQEIHQSFLEAGSDAILTNSFGANRYRLSKHQRAEQLPEILQAAGEIAQKCAGGQAFVLGSLGPLGVELEPLGRLAKAEAAAAFAEAAQHLAPFVDGFALETFDNILELECALQGVSSISKLPILAFLTLGEQGRTSHGTSAVESAFRAAQAGASAVGFNCSSGPRVVLDAVVATMSRALQVPIAAKPNAGMPREIDGRVFYENDPDYFARFGRRFLQMGGSIVGGCCGTTPDHIRALSQAARVGTAQLRPVTTSPPKSPAQQAQAQPALPLEQRSRFAARLARRETVISVELVPPRTPNMEQMLASARNLDRHGVDAINLPDGPRASARLSNISAAAILSRETNIEPLLHFCCRDRNLLGMQSDLLGAAALGLHNLLAITGDPPYQGDYPNLTAVFDVDAIGLCNMVHNLNQGLDLGGNPLGHKTSFCCGAALNHTALDLKRELDRAHWKMEAGVDFFMTQPVFDAQTLLQFLDQLPAEKPPILAGIWPLRSLRNAEFLHSEVPGVFVPDHILARMKHAEENHRGAEEGVAIACETVQDLLGKVAGFQVAAPFNKTEATLAVVATIREYPQ